MKYLFTLISIFISSIVYAQDLSGSIVGTVVNSKHRPIKNIAVYAYNTDSLVKAAITDKNGEYHINSVSAGVQYTVVINNSKYTTIKVFDVPVRPKGISEVNFKMRPRVKIGEVDSIMYELPFIHAQYCDAEGNPIIKINNVPTTSMPSRNNNQHLPVKTQKPVINSIK